MVRATDLARWIAQSPPNRRGATLELGAGLGLPSLAAAARGDRVVATDYEPDALAFAAHNAAQNGLALAVEQIDYRAWPAAHHQAYTVVLASDVLYEARAVDPVADSVRQVLAPGGEALIADPGRPYLDRFLTALSARGLEVTQGRAGETVMIQAKRAV